MVIILKTLNVLRDPIDYLINSLILLNAFKYKD